MTELEVQPRVNSESISHAFEQSLRGEGGLNFADKTSVGAPLSQQRTDENVEASTGPGTRLRLSRLNYAEDPLLDGDDEPEDSWLMPSPGPPSTHKVLDMSPPKEDLTARKRSNPAAAKRPAQTTNSRGPSGKREEPANSIGKKTPGSPAQMASKIPRVAQLGNSKSSNKTAATGGKDSGEKPARKRDIAANSSSSSATDADVSPAPSKASKYQSEKLKAAISGRRGPDVKREESAPSRMPSRPGSAASVSSVRTTTAPQKPVPRKAATPAAPRNNSGPLPAKAGHTASTAASRRRTSGSLPTSRRTSRTGVDTASPAPVELLRAISGPEEDLAALTRSSFEGEPAGSQAQDTGDSSSATKLGLEQQGSLTAGMTSARESAVPGEAASNGQSQTAHQQTSPASLPPLKDLPPVRRQSSGALSRARSNDTPRSGRASRVASPRPEWVDVIPPPEPEKVVQAPEPPKETPVETQSEDTPDKEAVPVPVEETEQAEEPPAVEEVVAAVADDKPATEEPARPGVGRKKAADLPHEGYLAPEASKKGCCGCVVM